MIKFFKRAIAGEPVIDDREARILRYRAAGSPVDSIHTLRGYQVDDLDYALMGADNACAGIKAGGADGSVGRWMTIKPSSKLARQSFGNSHGTKVGGEWITETAYMGVPSPEFYCDPAEVVWHRDRVDELTAQGTPQPERVRIMNEERASKPWLAP